MDARTAIRINIDCSKFICAGYLADLSDADLMRRPAPGCNHINWQLGHLITAENRMIEAVVPGAMPALPAGFAERYTKETAASDDPQAFCTKEELMTEMERQRGATLTALARVSDQRLAEPSPEQLRSYAPTVADVFSLQGSHWTMHSGQWVVVRRQLGKPPLF